MTRSAGLWKRACEDDSGLAIAGLGRTPALFGSRWRISLPCASVRMNSQETAISAARPVMLGYAARPSACRTERILPSGESGSEGGVLYLVAPAWLGRPAV